MVLQSCDQCASAVCIPAAQASGATSSTSSSKTNIGAIAGGVVGGVVVIIIVCFLLWKFCLKGKRRQIEEDYEFPEEKSMHQDNFGMHRSARASTHTVQSMASTVLTRASNIIQIAYIPGVTNRSTASPGLLVPPVPPIPSATSSISPYRDTTNTEEQLFFTAGDIRDSTYSGMTGYSSHVDGDNRTSIAPSLARSSVATTIYKATAQVSPLPAPTQTMFRGNAKVVSVNKGHNSSSSSATSTPLDTPPVPQIDYAKHSSQSSNGPRTIQVQMPASTDALGGPSPSGSVKTVTIGAKPVPLNIVKRPGFGSKSSSGGVPTISTIAEAVSKAADDKPRGLGLQRASLAGSMDSHARAGRIDETATEDESSEDETAHERSRRSLLAKDQSPFSDGNRVNSSEVAPTLQSFKGKGKAKVQDDDDARNQSPFEDSNAVL